MDEHDDDLDSEVQEGAEQETDSFPVTGDEFDAEDEDLEDEDDEFDVDEDETEL